MKRTFILIAILGVVLGGMLTGCGGDQTTTPPSTTSTNAPAAAPATK